MPTRKTEVTDNILNIIKKIPFGKVATYGQIGLMAGSPFYARQVAWILHSLSKKENLPWHRVINNKGEISLKQGHGFEKQKLLLKKEGIKFNKNNRIDLVNYLWNPCPDL